jgi:hypothetical protein
MAETQVEHAPNHAPEVLTQGVPDEPQPSEPTKRPVGRPRNDGRPAGSAKETRPPAPNEDGGEYTDFFSDLKLFPKSDWDEQLMMYLYRTHPLIDLGIKGKGEWKIEKFCRPVDAQEILERHGSGGYKVLLCRWDPVTRRTTLLRTHYFTMLNMTYPPKVPFGSWLDREDNKDWLWAKPALEKQIGNGTAPPGQTSDAALFQAAVNAVKDLRPEVNKEDQTTLTKLVIDTMKEANNPATTLSLVNTVVSAIAGKGDGAANGIMTLVTSQLNALQTELAAERAFNRELLTKLTTPAAAPAAGEKKSLKSEVLELADTMSALGFQKGGGTDWAEAGVEIGKEILKSLTVLGTAIITKQPAKPGQAQQQQRPAPVIDAHAQIAAPPAAAAAEPQQQTPEEAMSTIQQLSNQFGGLFDQCAPFLVDQFVKGFSGMEFREWFKESYGAVGYNAMRGMDPRTIFDVIELRKTQGPEHVQQLLQQLQPPDELLTFITQFLSDEPVDDDEEPDEAPAPAAAKQPTPIQRKGPTKIERPKEQPPAAAPFVDPNQHQEF